MQKSCLHELLRQEITFESLEEIPWTLDGEYGGSHDVVEIMNQNKAMELMVPSKYVDELSEDEK